MPAFLKLISAAMALAYLSACAVPDDGASDTHTVTVTTGKCKTDMKEDECIIKCNAKDWCWYYPVESDKPAPDNQTENQNTAEPNNNF